MAPRLLVARIVHALPPIIFVLGKGGVGRSTVAAALGVGLAARGERVMILQWAVTDAVSPWFGLPATGFRRQALAPNLTTRNFSLDASFEQYFVEHLGMRAFYRRVIENRHVQRAIAATPGLAELMFLGNAMAEIAIQHSCDRVIVDAPAMGHGESLLGMPRVTRSLAFGGLLAVECDRVEAMLGDPARSAAIVVTTADELAVEETIEFWPRIARDLGRSPIALAINLSVAPLGPLPADPAACPWYAELSGPPELEIAYAQLAHRARRERQLGERLSAARTLAIADAALLADDPSPREVVARATELLAPLWSER